MHAKRNTRAEWHYLVSQVFSLLLVADGAGSGVMAGLHPQWLAGTFAFCWPMTVMMLAAGCFRAQFVLRGRRSDLARREAKAAHWELQLTARHARLMAAEHIARLQGKREWN